MAFVLAVAASARADLGVPISAPAPLNANAAVDSVTDQHPRLAGDGNGNWVAVWELLGSANGPFGADNDVMVARSIDNGQNWSSPIPLNTNAAFDNGSDFGPSVATDGQGRWVAVWTVVLVNPVNIDVVYARSSNNGATWTDPIPLDVNALADSGLDGAARIAMNENGRCVVVWASSVGFGGTLGNDSDILVARSADGGVSWSNPAPLNSNAVGDAGDDGVPVISIDSQGRCVAVWQSNQTPGNSTGSDYDIVVARSLDGGANWSNPFALNANAGTDSASDLNPDVAMDNNGNCVAVWVSSANPMRVSPLFILTARSIDGGANWSLPVPIHPHDADDRHIELAPSIATDRQGRWVVGWRVDGNLLTPPEDSDLLVVRSADNGANWSSPSALNSDAAADTGFDVNPHVATDRRGNWLAAWESNKSPTGTAGSDRDLRVARFALPDCNSNLMADAAEIAAGLATDGNFNGIPDGCEASFIAPPPGGTSIVTGLCGGGMAALVPISLVGIACMGRSVRRLYS